MSECIDNNNSKDGTDFFFKCGIKFNENIFLRISNNMKTVAWKKVNDEFTP